jgi:hypothetical protein
MKTTRRRLFRVAMLVLVAAAMLVAVRMWLEPKDSPAPPVDLSAAARQRLATIGEQSRIDEARMSADLLTADVLLVGEDHFYRETNEYLTRMLDSVGRRRIVLLLEIPSNLQPAVDAFVADGASSAFDAAVREGDALPLQHILQWAHRNRTKVSRVIAVDEPRGRIFVNRALLRETRNRTMANAVLDSLERAPGDLVVVYGGQLHMTLGGRYRYDLENRTPAGALLARQLERRRIRSIMLSGKGKSPASEVLPAGVYAAAEATGGEPFAYFIDYPIFRASTARELFDYYVVLGDLTRIGGR